MNKHALLFVATLIVLMSCQPAPTPLLPTFTPMPTVTVFPSTPTPLSITTMTVKFTENDCTYDGPKSIPYDKFTVNWVVDEPKHNKTGLVILTLDTDKTINDLKAILHYGEPPSWVHALWIDEENAFGTELKKIRRYSHEHDLQTQAGYHGESLYIICGNEEYKTGALGPIEVKK